METHVCGKTISRRARRRAEAVDWHSADAGLAAGVELKLRPETQTPRGKVALVFPVSTPAQPRSAVGGMLRVSASPC
jgi:hypothetical protein